MNVEEWGQLLYQYDIYLNIFVLLAFLFFAILSWYYIGYFFLALQKAKKFPKGEKQYKFAILVPARNEDKVIGNLLKSLKKQDYPKDKFDVFVIVESKDDPTIKLTEKAGYKVIIRKDLINKRTKGYALDEAYQFIKNNNLEYDAFMIFDADNIVNSDYISLMNDVKNQGYKVGTGYRNFTNATTNWVTGCSAVLFSFMNQFTSNGRSKIFKKATLTGTGYYVDKDIVDDAGGWIWDGMTEDVEMTAYCYYHNISMIYYNFAQYFDEQSSQYRVLHKQHIRWVWGFFGNKKPYTSRKPDYKALPKWMVWFSLFEYNISIYPFVTFCIMETLAFLMSFIIFIGGIVLACLSPAYVSQLPMFFGFAVLFFMYIYGTFMIAAGITFIIDNKRLKFPPGKVIVSIISYMFFFMDFVFAFFDGLFHKKKRKSWDKIEHSGDVVDLEAQKALNAKKKKR